MQSSISVREFNKKRTFKMRSSNLGAQAGVRTLLHIPPGHNNENATFVVDSEGVRVGLRALSTHSAIQRSDNSPLPTQWAKLHKAGASEPLIPFPPTGDIRQQIGGAIWIEPHKVSPTQPHHKITLRMFEVGLIPADLHKKNLQ
jgi:hypothetical protein